jgi:hypothetical protein
MHSPSSDPVNIMGSSGWNLTAETFWACPSNVCTHVLFWEKTISQTFFSDHLYYAITCIMWI